jgi:heptose-I-phosphate ethanolaminephosphotransferase
MLTILVFLCDVICVHLYDVVFNKGIINAVLETNLSEAAGFIQMYIDWKSIVLCILVPTISIVFVRKFEKAKIAARKVGVWLLIIIVLWGAVLFVKRSYAYAAQEDYYLGFFNGIMSVRISANIKASLDDIRAYKHILNEINQAVQLTRNEAQIKNVIFIVGESTNSRHLSLYGYPLETTPNLSFMYEHGNLYRYDDVISSMASTAPSLSKMFTYSSYERDKNLPWYKEENLISILKAAGYRTYWLSNQETSGIYGGVAQVLASISEKKIFTKYRDSQEEYYSVYDGELLPIIEEAMNEQAEKKFMVIHLMGSHGMYESRYPTEYDVFKASDIQRDLSEDKRQMIAEYDNTVLYNDYVVSEIIKKFTDSESLVVYVSDHGEEVYDYKEIYGHAMSHNGSKYTFAVPMLVYTSPQFKERYPQKEEQIRQATKKPFMTDDIIHAILDIMDIATPDFDESRSLFNEKFNDKRKRMVYGMDYDIEVKGRE